MIRAWTLISLGLLSASPGHCAVALAQVVPIRTATGIHTYRLHSMVSGSQCWVSYIVIDAFAFPIDKSLLRQSISLCKWIIIWSLFTPAMSVEHLSKAHSRELRGKRCSGKPKLRRIRKFAPTKGRRLRHCITHAIAAANRAHHPGLIRTPTPQHPYTQNVQTFHLYTEHIQLSYVPKAN